MPVIYVDSYKSARLPSNSRNNTTNKAHNMLKTKTVIDYCFGVLVARTYGSANCVSAPGVGPAADFLGWGLPRLCVRPTPCDSHSRISQELQEIVPELENIYESCVTKARNVCRLFILCAAAGCQWARARDHRRPAGNRERPQRRSG